MNEENIIDNMAAKAKSVEELLGRYQQWPENGRSVARDVARRYLIIRAERDVLKARLDQARAALIAITEVKPEQDNDTDIEYLVAGLKRARECTDRRALMEELKIARTDANRLADELRKTEWVAGSDENSYCGWCGGPEPGPKPIRKDYYSDQSLGRALEDWASRGHKPDCTRQAARAALPPEQEA